VVAADQPEAETAGDARGGRRLLGADPWLACALALAALAAAWQIVTLGRVVAARLTYPGDLEWMEGGHLYHAHRVLHGEALYGAPADGFLPFIYGPVHAWLLAAVGRVAGLDYATGRLLSVACIALTAGMLAREVWRHAGGGVLGTVGGLVAVGTVAAGFPATGGWYDLVRNDALALALPVLAAALVADPARLGGRGRAVAVATLLAAGVLTRQTDLAYAAWIGLFALVTDRRAGLRICAVTAALVGGVSLALQLGSGGWYLTWLMLPSRQPLDLRVLPRAAEVVLGVAPYLALVPVLAAVLAWRRWLSPRGVLWLGMLVAAAAASLVPFLKVGRFVNDLIPLVVLAGPVTLILALDLLAGLDRAGRPPAARLARIGRLALFGGAAVLLAGLIWSPDRHVPDTSQRQAADRLNAYVAALDGGVLSPDDMFLAIHNGHDDAQTHVIAHDDAVAAGLPGAELERFVAASDARWVLVDPQDAGEVRRADWFHAEPDPTPGAPHTLTGRETAPSITLRRVDRRDRQVVFDFESPGAGRGWDTTGDAFGRVGVPLDAAAPDTRNTRGDRLASSGGDSPGPGAEGTLTSPPFTLAGTHVGLLVGGGRGSATRVELVVAGTVVARASGDDAPALRYVAWDVSPWQGREARIRLVDEAAGRWGYVQCDQVETFSLAAPE
jgi:hypothetical protein